MPALYREKTGSCVQNIWGHLPKRWCCKTKVQIHKRQQNNCKEVPVVVLTANRL